MHIIPLRMRSTSTGGMGAEQLEIMQEDMGLGYLSG